jgi:hypothetical protein
MEKRRRDARPDRDSLLVTSERAVLTVVVVLFQYYYNEHQSNCKRPAARGREINLD